MNGTPQDRWEQWLYQDHSPEELRAWSQRLHWFRFCRAVGGHANDCDELRVVFRVDTEPDLRAACTVLGIPLTEVSPDVPQPIPGVSYSGTDYAKFQSLIPEFPHLAQPGHTVVAGEFAFAWIAAGRLQLSPANPENPYEVTTRTIDSALKIESLLLPLAPTVIDPPFDNPHCISPKHYPHWWPNPGN